MARNTERPIPIQEGIEISLAENLLKVSGKNGDLSMSIHPLVLATTPEKELLFSPKEGTKESIAMVGTMRALAINMIKGVSDGFEKKLEINGVGYRAKLSGDKLELSLGFSHPVIYQLPEGVNADVPSQTEVVLKSANKQLLGETAAKIRSFRPPEPYKGKGVKYAEERIKRKESKKA
jgi:large subunit ribosomal protein L6